MIKGYCQAGLVSILFYEFKFAFLAIDGINFGEL